VKEWSVSSPKAIRRCNVTKVITMALRKTDNENRFIQSPTCPFFQTEYRRMPDSMSTANKNPVREGETRN
jgi:hypothetical protein